MTDVTYSTGSELTTIPTASIEVSGLNPREVDRGSESFKGLCTSIGGRGISQPLLLRREADGSLQVVAGHRRFAAAQEVGLEEVPALVVDLDDDAALLASIEENVQRENMTPLEEAKALLELRNRMGLRQVDAAQVLGKSERWARERERLLELPDEVVASIDTGKVPLEATVHIQKVADVSPKAAAALVDFDVDDDGQAQDEEINLTTMAGIGHRLRQVADVAGAAAISRGHTNLSEIPLTPTQQKKVKQTIKDEKVPPYDQNWIRFVPEDLDAARAYGVLLEVPGLFGKGETYVTDMEWLTDRIIVAIEREAKRRRENDAAYGSDEETTEKEKATKARRKEIRAEARTVNANLVVALETAKVPTLTMEMAQIFAGVVLDRELDRTAKRYGPYGDDRYAPAKDEDRRPADVLVERIKAAKTPEAVLWIALSIVVRGVVSLDEDPHGPSPKLQLVYPDRIVEDDRFNTRQMVEKLALDKGLVPQPIRDAVEARWDKINERAAQRAKGEAGAVDEEVEAGA